MRICRVLDIRLFYNLVPVTDIMKPQIIYGSIVIYLSIRNDLTGNYRGTFELTNPENLAEENLEISLETCASQTSYR
jgi:hypothetical protein